MIAAGDCTRAFMGRTVSGNNQQLIEAEASHDSARNLNVPVVHRIERPAECSYAKVAHKICFWFVISGFSFGS
jgi:hypothetical protein